MNKVKSERTWIVVFVACFLGLLVEDMDLIMLSITLPSLMEEFSIEKYKLDSLLHGP